MQLDDYLPYLRIWATSKKYLSLYDIYCDKKVSVEYEYLVYAYSFKYKNGKFSFYFMKFLDGISINDNFVKVKDLDKYKDLCLKFDLGYFI